MDPAPGEVRQADFRYSPPWWQTAICLPDDPDKTLVGREGQLLFDFGGGGLRNFGLCVQPEVEGGSRWERQGTLSARAPIVQTWSDAGGVEVFQETFVAVDGRAANETAQRLTRTDGAERLADWARPARPCAAAFTGAEIAWNGGTLRFRLKSPGRPVLVVFGLCEGYHQKPGARPLVLEVEGGEPVGRELTAPSASGAKRKTPAQLASASAPVVLRTLADPVKEFGPAVPGLWAFVAQDKNGDGVIDLAVTTPGDNQDRNAILNGLWVFDQTVPALDAVLDGTAAAEVYACWPVDLPERRLVTLLTLKNPTAAAVERRPQLRVQTMAPGAFHLEDGTFTAGGGTRLAASERIELCQTLTNHEFLISLPVLSLAPGSTRQVAFTLDRHQHHPTAPLSVKAALGLREASRRWWEKGTLPFDTIHVPDPAVQGILESCVRNIWQAREIKMGQPAFQVGPTVYRGLWVVDGSFLLESAALLGRGHDARAGIEYLLSHQKPDGSFELLGRHWKENGIVLWAATRHALLTQDKEWLRAHWPALQRVVQAIHHLRVSASADPVALDYRLLPAGFIDGGLVGEGKPEYSNTYWCLAGLKAAIAAARWLGDAASAADWQHEFDDFYAAFRQAAARDTCHDAFGHAYVPTMMANFGGAVPARGQWAFCHAVYPGQVFAADDPLVAGQLAMLGATKVEGMVYDTGWMHEGLWTYFASFYGHALLWQHQATEAADVLYAFAQHAAPTRVWREEQKPVGKGNDEVGDMPHNWASAEFIRLTTHLLELDRGDELHLLEGFPPEWAGPGMVTRLHGTFTPFGPLYLEVRIAPDRHQARVKLKALKARPPARLVLHLQGLSGRDETLDLPVDADVDRTVSRGGY